MTERDTFVDVRYLVGVVCLICILFLVVGHMYVSGYRPLVWGGPLVKVSTCASPNRIVGTRRKVLSVFNQS